MIVVITMRVEGNPSTFTSYRFKYQSDIIPSGTNEQLHAEVKAGEI